MLTRSVEVLRMVLWHASRFSHGRLTTGHFSQRKGVCRGIRRGSLEGWCISTLVGESWAYTGPPPPPPPPAPPAPPAPPVSFPQWQICCRPLFSWRWRRLS
eukprot:69332-Pyramimonas_sp.AAC.1